MCNLVVKFIHSKCHSTQGVSLQFMHHTLLLLLQLMMLCTPCSASKPQIEKKKKENLPAQQFLAWSSLCSHADSMTSLPVSVVVTY